MRLYQFDEADSEINVKTYSPYAGQYQTGEDPEDLAQYGISGPGALSQFSLSMNFDARLGPSTVPEPSTFVLLVVGLISSAVFVFLNKGNRQLSFQRNDQMVTKMKVVLGVVIIASMLVVFGGPANASSVALVNPSFEDPAVSDPGGTVEPTPDNSPFGQSIGGWGTFDQNVVIWRPTSADFPALAGGSLPGPAAGQQCLLSIGDMDSGVAQLVQGITLQPHKIYTLTAAFGSPLTMGFTDNDLAFGYQDPTDPTGMTGGELGADDGPNSSGQPIPAPGAFVDNHYTIYSDNYIVPGAVPGSTDEYGNPLCAAGDNLVVVVELGPGGALDNVRLTVSDVPEPSTLVSLATAAVGLLAYAWRKRK
jgi:hypothetical protein